MTTENNTPTTETIEDVDQVLPEDDKHEFKIPQGFRLITDDEAEVLANQVIEDSRDKWEIQEICDDCVVAGQSNNFLRNEFLYEYKKGSKLIRGLTAPMIKCLAVARGVSEVTEERKYTSDNDVSEFEVVVELVNPKDKNHKQKMSGFAEHPKYQGGIYNPFHKQSAHSKAFRNAALPFIPIAVIQETIYRLSQIVPLDWTPSQTETSKVTQKAYQNCIKAFTRHQDDIEEKYSVTREQFANAIPVYYNVDNRKQLTFSQWENIRYSLENGYKGMVEDIINIIHLSDDTKTSQDDVETTPDTPDTIDTPETEKNPIQDNLNNMTDALKGVSVEDSKDESVEESDEGEKIDTALIVDDSIPF